MQRGKIWGNKTAIAGALKASQVELRSAGSTEAHLIEVEEIDRDGSALFTMMAKA